MKTKINFSFPHGALEGIHYKAKVDSAPLVIITNGQNGFYSYGMFPYIQEKLFEHDISSFSYSFSHGGVTGDDDFFSSLALYEKNCMRLETDDLYEIGRSIKKQGSGFFHNNKFILLAHSMGSVPTIFGAKKLLAEGYTIDGIILVAPIKTLDRWPQDILKEWEKTGLRFVKNNRTKQDLPQGKELLEEVKQANGIWNLQQALKQVRTNFLLIHGDKDEAVDAENSFAINDWNKNNGTNSELQIIPGAGHTFGTKHPFEGTTNELDQVIKETIEWIRKL